MSIVPDRLLTYGGRLKRYRPLIEAAFMSKHLPVHWGLSIAKQESGFRPWARNDIGGDRRRGGAWGLFQMTLETAQGLGYRGDGPGLLDPVLNADYAARFIAELRNKWHNLQDVAAAYNSGKPYPLAPATTRLTYCPRVVQFARDFEEAGLE